MSKKCVGCGILLQDNNILLEGYTTNLNNEYCMRCFKMTNYGEYEFVTKSNQDYIDILKKIGTKKTLVLYVVDLLSVPNDLVEIKKYLKKNPIILVLNKQDVLSSSISDEKIISYFNNQELNFLDIILISSAKERNLNNLYNKIKKYKTSKDVYVVGNTNAGKSTLINHLASKNNIEESKITISPMPSTTLSEIKTEFKDFNLIDTPGLVDDGNILNYVSKENIKKISTKKQIKPRTYRIFKNEGLVLGDILRIDYINGERNSFTFFVSNDIPIKRVRTKNPSLKNLSSKQINLKYHEDIVINGLGFIKTILEGEVTIYIDKDVDVFTRKSLI